MGNCIIARATPSIKWDLDKIEPDWSAAPDKTVTRNCLEIGDVKIQWGILNQESTRLTTVEFKSPFTYTGYAAYASIMRGDTTPTTHAYVTNETTTSCQVEGEGGWYSWLCIGI